jgi:transcriptional regulator with XRE-family HTH domain
MPELLAAALKRLREDRGLSRSQLSRLTVRVGYEGVPEITIKSLESTPGRMPDAETLRELAMALGVEPSTFYEWPILEAREATKKARGSKTELRTAQERAAQRTRERPGSKPAGRRGRRPQEGTG